MDTGVSRKLHMTVPVSVSMQCSTVFTLIYSLLKLSLLYITFGAHSYPLKLLYPRFVEVTVPFQPFLRRWGLISHLTVRLAMHKCLNSYLHVGNMATANDHRQVRRCENRKVLNRIPGQWGHPGPFRDKGTKSGSVWDVPGWLNYGFQQPGSVYCQLENLLLKAAYNNKKFKSELDFVLSTKIIFSQSFCILSCAYLTLNFNVSTNPAELQQ